MDRRLLDLPNQTCVPTRSISEHRGGGPRPRCGLSGSRGKSAYSCRLAQLLVAESPPQVPTGHGSEGAPFFPEKLDVAALTIHVRDGALQSDVAEGKHIGFSKNHDPEY